MPDTKARPHLTRPVALLSLAAFASAASLRVADPLLPQLAEEFRASVAEASVVATGFTLAYGLSQFLYGPLGDRFGKFAIVALATLASAIGTGLTAFSGDLQTLALLRFLSGSTAGAIIPMAMAHIGDAVSYEERQRVLANFMSGQVMGVIAGQALGGVIGDLLGWRGVFAVLGFLYLAIGALLLSERASVRAGGNGRPLSVRGLAHAYIGLARSAHVRVVLGSVFLEGLLFFGGFAYIGAFLRERAGLGYAVIGVLLAFFGLGALVYTTMASRLIPRLGREGLVTAGGVALTLGFAVFALEPYWPAAAAGVAVCGLGFYMLHNTLQTLATQMAPAMRGVAVSVFAACLFLGQAAGVALGGVAATALGYGPVFLGAGLGLLALAGFLRTRVAGTGS